jgi:Tfp pilus assembly protein PilP
MANSRLGCVGNCRVGHLLLLAAVTGLAWAGLSAAQPAFGATAEPQGQGMAAKAVARRAAAAKVGAATPAPENQAAEEAKESSSSGGRRDPFLIPMPPKGGAGAVEAMNEGGGPLPPGKRGLLIGQLKLEGVVRQSGDKPMIAVVTNSTNRAYFLRENDEVYNGVVSKITPDSIYFTETVRDATGQMSSRQVIKRLGSGPGENR